MFFGDKRISVIIRGNSSDYNIAYNEGYTAGHEQGITDGKTAERETFWKRFQEYGNRTTYSGAFYDSWFDDIYNPIYPLAPTSAPNGLNNTFAYTNITDTKVTIDARHVNSLYYTFHYAGALVRIPKLIVHRDLVFNTSFTNCKNLETLIIEGEIGQTINLLSSDYLSTESIISILHNLVDYSGTENEFAYVVGLSTTAWWRINYYATPPAGFSKWQEYVASLGWNT